MVKSSESQKYLLEQHICEVLRHTEMPDFAFPTSFFPTVFVLTQLSGLFFLMSEDALSLTGSLSSREPHLNINHSHVCLWVCFFEDLSSINVFKFIQKRKKRSKNDQCTKQFCINSPDKLSDCFSWIRLTRCRVFVAIWCWITSTRTLQ